MSRAVLDVRNLTVQAIKGEKRDVLVDNVSFSVEEGRCLGIVGESGSGKSITWKAVMRMTDWSLGAFVTSGHAFLNGVDLFRLLQREMRAIRGRHVCMILQNPMNCFDPLCRIGTQIEEGYSRGTPKANRLKTLEMLDSMRIANPDEVLKKYPHQLSGGMLQRVMIGIALAAEPDLIIADEPTTAIDSLTQFDILQEFKRIKDQRRTALIFISHDIACVSMLADHILVMYKGQVRRYGDAREILTCPDDEYSHCLIQTKRNAIGHFRRVMAGGV